MLDFDLFVLICRKTTTMLFKMLGHERSWEKFANIGDLPKPRQVFVTQSRVLAGKVEEYFSKLNASLAAGAKTREEVAIIARNQSEDLVDLDDDLNWRADLPDRFSQLRAEHFPLFITFDGVSLCVAVHPYYSFLHQLCNLLETDFLHNEALDTHNIKRYRHSVSADGSSNFVTFEAFLKNYWPHFSQMARLGMDLSLGLTCQLMLVWLDPSLVFSEFMGVFANERLL